MVPLGVRSKPPFAVVLRSVVSLAAVLTFGSSPAFADPPTRVVSVGGEGRYAGAYMRAAEPRLRAFATNFTACAAAARRRGITLSLEHEVSFTLTEEGRVRQVVLASRDGGALSECVSNFAGRLRFARPPITGRVWARYALAPVAAPSAAPSSAAPATGAQPVGARAPATR